MDLLSTYMAQQSRMTPQAGYTLADGTLVRPAAAVDPSSVGGQAYGGQGMAMPAGATGVAGSQNGAMYGSILSGLISNLGQAASSYASAKASQPLTTGTVQTPDAFNPGTMQVPFAPVSGMTQMIQS